MAQSFNYAPYESSHHDHQPTLASHMQEALQSKTLKIAATIGVLAAGTMLALHEQDTTAGTSEETQVTHLDKVTSVHLEDGARIRHSPTAENEPPIAELDAPTTIMTPQGVEMRTEFHNGRWIGVNATDIPNFDSKFDSDGIVWINEQKATTESDPSK